MGNVIVDFISKNNDNKIIVNNYIENDPLSEENLEKTLNIVNEICLSFGNTKTIWLYTGYQWESIMICNTI